MKKLESFFLTLQDLIKWIGNQIKIGLIKGNILFYVIVLIILSSSAIMYNINITNLKDYYKESITYQKDQEFESIWILINETKNNAKRHANKTSENIEKEVLSLKNLNELEMALNKGMSTVEFDAILRRHIEGNYFTDIHNDENGMIVLTKNRILANFGRSTIKDKPYKSINEFIKTFANPILSMTAYDKISHQHPEELFITERIASDNPTHKLYNVISKETLKEIYFNEGLEGFKTYTFLVPSYITAYGDVFGKPDIENGQRIDNNKLIVVQMFNIYDQITSHYNNFSDFDSIILQEKYNHIIINMYLLGIFLSIAIIGLLVLMCYRINQIIGDDSDTPLDQQQYAERLKQ